MPTKLILLEDGIFVEAEVPSDMAQQISGGLAEKVKSTFDRIQPMLIKISKSISGAWKEINKDMQVDRAEIELGFGFEGEGNVYVTKVKADANITVKLILTPKAKEG